MARRPILISGIVLLASAPGVAFLVSLFFHPASESGPGSTQEAPVLAPAKSQARELGKFSTAEHRGSFQQGGAKEWLLSLSQDQQRDGTTGLLRLLESGPHLSLSQIMELAEAAKTGRHEAGIDTGFLDRVSGILVCLWGRLDQEGALGYFKNVPFKLTNQSLMDAYEALHNGRTDLDGFWIPALDEEREFLAAEIAKTDPMRAIAIGEEFVTGSGNSPAIVRSAFQSWLNYDRDAALAWAESYEGPAEPDVTGAFLDAIAQESPQRASEIYSGLESLPPGAHLTAGFIAENLVEVDADATARWVESLDKGEPKEWATRAMLYGWSAEQPMSALAWVGRLEDGELRNQAVWTLVRSLGETHPSELEALVKTVSDPETQKLCRDKIRSEQELKEKLR